MIQRLVICAWGLLLFTTIASSQARELPPLPKGVVNIGDPAKIKAVLAREEEKRAAYTKLDPKLVGDLMTEDYLMPNVGGCCFSNKELAMESVVEHRDAKIPMPITSMSSDETVVRVYGRMAIVSGISTINMMVGQPTQAKPVSVKVLYMDIWELRRGKWMLIGSSHNNLF